MRRYGSLNVPITSAGVIVYGLILLISPATSFQSLAFRQGPFLVVGQHDWAWAFIASGALALAVHHLLAVFPLLLVVACWAMLLALAALTVDGVSPTAGLAWVIIAVELLVSAAVRGVHPPGAP